MCPSPCERQGPQGCSRFGVSNIPSYTSTLSDQCAIDFAFKRASAQAGIVVESILPAY